MPLDALLKSLAYLKMKGGMMGNLLILALGVAIGIVIGLWLPQDSISIVNLFQYVKRRRKHHTAFIRLMKSR